MKGAIVHNFVPKNFIIDADGVLTDGRFYYTLEGKAMKRFGPDDNDALSLIRDRLYIHIITGDKRGFSITKKRVVRDMKLPLDLVSTFERVEWIANRCKLEETIYMGDGIFDGLVFDKVAYSIAPASAFYTTKEKANYVTKSKAAEGAVAEACLHILENFFNIPFDLNKLSLPKISGAWKKGE